MTDPKDPKSVLEEIEWQLKDIWSEYQKNQKEDKHKAKLLLEEYQRLRDVYKRQQMIIKEL